MSNLKRRIERVEQQILGEDDEIITIDWLSGPPVQMTMGEFRQLLRVLSARVHEMIVWARYFRLVPVDSA